ncbi:hypothetical protein BT63DRAFT_261765 [Microthyrium microscopicum]|uniref:F-box domain-containing protein n=1 Tax=Microthyrium microscopicum TaxID=703497 RepID=A0A6A6UC32_9PEZI|nr:hypothetical protein BT63DRAFT_261765 [Microthyrium microscopicum]
MPHIEYLASELLIQIFDHVGQVQDVLNLGATCHRLHDVQTSSRQLYFLQDAAERQYGPLDDAFQLLTQNDSQEAHIQRPIKVSLALLKQVVHVGRVAETWADTYPFKKWKDDYTNRRLLSLDERFKVRRAIYRLWLYTRAFHTPSHPRESRLYPSAMRARSALLHIWPTDELAEIADVRGVIRDILASNVCPSNGAVTRKFVNRHGDDAARQLVFNLTNIHLTFPPPAPPCPPNTGHFAQPPKSELFEHSPTFRASTTRTKALHLGRYGGLDAGNEGWGDSMGHYYVVEDMLKLDPERILWLKERKMGRAQVVEYIRGLGDWFENYGDTWGETLEYVLAERGEFVEDVMDEGGIVGYTGEDED